LVIGEHRIGTVEPEFGIGPRPKGWTPYRDGIPLGRKPHYRTIQDAAVEVLAAHQAITRAQRRRRPWTPRTPPAVRTA
jgi:hypothetical protein